MTDTINADTTRRTITADERFAVLDAIYRYATAIDNRDWALFRAAFTDDAYVDFGFQQWDNGDDYAAFMQVTHDPAGRTLHRMNNTTITRVREGEIEARTYGEAIVLQADKQSAPSPTAGTTTPWCALPTGTASAAASCT